MGNGMRARDRFLNLRMRKKKRMVMASHFYVVFFSKSGTGTLTGGRKLEVCCLTSLTQKNIFFVVPTDLHE